MMPAVLRGRYSAPTLLTLPLLHDPQPPLTELHLLFTCPDPGSPERLFEDTELLLRRCNGAVQYGKIITKLGYEARFQDFKVQNIVGSTDVKFPIRLEGLAYGHAIFASVSPPSALMRVQCTMYQCCTDTAKICRRGRSTRVSDAGFLEIAVRKGGNRHISAWAPLDTPNFAK